MVPRKVTKEAQYVQFVNRKLTGATELMEVQECLLLSNTNYRPTVYTYASCTDKYFGIWKLKYFSKNNKLFAQKSPPEDIKIDVRRPSTAMARKVLLLRFREA